MKIHDIPKNTLVIKHGDTLPIEELREQWESMTHEEKRGWYTTTCERFRIEADDVIDYIIEKMSDDSYEEMDVFLAGNLPSDATEKLQAVLDELFDNDAADVYYPDKLIEVTE
ncbi:hypothetical protein SAG0027_11030 [Streptococcus agalactiae FSL S3-251]|uniref:hypothetical protein n=1 Tax=Streptococcus agalactiae TaxID=1311 RepID=UPI0002F346B0|nr:hypothetical protein [Streptococcus agalactiae]EPV98107.1 hypothetical protein SAG0027_11030 [Streptococcus agalactiae FSL S3-251]SUN02004.1 Uncharacterised protein [Streptococcus agalactiae]SUN03044.1 Uncharacterised protein [Streptococcus agalactiae]